MHQDSSSLVVAVSALWLSVVCKRDNSETYGLIFMTLRNRNMIAKRRISIKFWSHGTVLTCSELMWWECALY